MINASSFRRLLVFTSFTFGICCVALGQNAQKNDVILKRDNTRIQALILQMTYEKINYRDLGTRDSAKTYISMDKVSRIFLKNGKIINVKDSIPATKLPPDSIGQYADLSNLPADPFERSVVMANSDQLRDKYEYHHNRALDGKTGFIVFSSLGAGALASGLIVASNGSTDNKKIGTSLAIAGPLVGGVLALIGYRNWRMHSSKAAKVRTELQRRNQSLSFVQILPVYDPGRNVGGLTVTFHF